MTAWYDNAELMQYVADMTKAVQYAAAEVIVGNLALLVACLALFIMGIVIIRKTTKLTEEIRQLNNSQTRIAANQERIADYMERMLWAKYGPGENQKKE